MAVIQASFPGKTKDNSWVLGDSCHQQANAQVPVLVVTDLKGVILISSEATDNSSWVVSRARVNISRFWTASTAFIKCSINLTNPNDCLPPLTFVEPFRPFKNAQAADDSIPEDVKTSTKPEPNRRQFPLGQGDEICIYIGYKNYLGEPITNADLGTRLLRVFIGSIDTVIDSTSTNDGFSFSIECRDRMKYLMDSLSSFNSAEGESLISDIGKNGQISRKDVIMAIAKRAVGDLRNSTSCNAANCGFYIRAEDKNTQDVSFTDSYDGFRNYQVPKEGSNITFLGGKTTDKLEDISFFPKFNIITGKMPFANGSDLQTNYVVTERVAIEYIKYLSLLEPVMTEVFCDHRTGDYWYCPRGVDSSGLNDPKRFYRTYFNRIAPAGVSELYNVQSNVNRTTNVSNSPGSVPGRDISFNVDGAEELPNSAPEEVHACQKLILFREEQSTLSWRSNIIVTKSNAASGGEAMSVHLRVVPPRFKYRAFPCSYYTVVDPSINSSAELVGVALAYARSKGKEVRAATAHMIGDPSLTPGEAIQVLGAAPKNSIKLPSHKEMLDSAIADKTNFVTYYGLYQDFALDLAKQVKNSQSTAPEEVKLNNNYVSVVTSATGTTNNTITPTSSGASNTQIMCDFPVADENGLNGEQAVPDNNLVAFMDDPETIWRVEGLIHRFNDGTPGYYTELGLITPF